MSALISVITICYNPGDDLLPTIQSVINQKDCNLEYIIIDGKSSDGSVELIRQIAEKDDRIKWISQKDEGIYDAMNKGIDLATGNWLNFMNAGDKFANNEVLSQIEFDKYKEVGLIYGNITKDNSTVILPKTTELLKYGKIMACHQAMFFNKVKLGKELKYDSKLILNGDSELVTRIHHKGIDIKYINHLIAYYKGDGASSNFIFKSKIQKYKRVWKYYGIKGLIRTLMMQQGMIKASKFSVN